MGPIATVVTLTYFLCFSNRNYIRQIRHIMLINTSKYHAYRGKDNSTSCTAAGITTQRSATVVQVLYDIFIVYVVVGL